MGKRVQFYLKLFSYDSELLATAAEKVIAAGLTELSVESVINGPITLPNIIRRWCLLKSPHVYKDISQINIQRNPIEIMVIN